MTPSLLVTGTREAVAADARDRAHEHELAGWILGSRWHYREARRLRRWAAFLLGDTDDRAHPAVRERPDRRRSWEPPRAARMDAPGGPVCGCGRPSTHQSGWCGTDGCAFVSPDVHPVEVER